MDISVIVPIYGVEKYIEKSLRSLFSQTKTEGVEFILVNDQTKDRSIEIAREVIADFPTLDIKIIEHETNRGLAGARQSGMDVASGDYVIHVDSDDWCESEMLEELYESATKNNADIVGCDFFWSYPGKDVYSKQQLPPTKEEYVSRLFTGAIQCVVWNKLVKRELYKKNNLKWVAGLNMGEDLLISSKVILYCDVINYIPKAYVHYIQRSNSFVNSCYSDKTVDSILRVVREIELFYEKNGVADRFSQQLLTLKSKQKQYILRNVERCNRKRYSKLYPEAKELLFEDVKRSARSKSYQTFGWSLATYLGYYNRFELLDILLWCQKKIGNKRY